LIVGTEKSLYAVDGETGEVLWRRKDVRLDESDVAPVVGTDLLLLSFEKGGKTRVEAVDLMAGNRLEYPWLGGRVRELGREHGIPTPANDFIGAALKPFLSGKAPAA